MTTIIRANNNGRDTTIVDSNRPLVFYFSDFFDPEVLSDMEEQFGRPDVVICDVEGTVEDIGYPFYFVPALYMGMLNFAARPLLQQRREDILQTDYCFCWSINRKHIDRHVVIKLVEFFNLGPYNYTWSGVDSHMDMQPVIDEINQTDCAWLTPELFTHLLAPVNHKTRWIAEPAVDDTAIATSRRQHGSVLSRWLHVEKYTASPSAVYLLTESITQTYNHYTFSERSAFCFLAGCFPIWTGNYGQAEMAERMGVDVFHDVINHRYQYKKTLLERCWYAIHDNLEILSSLSLARDLREKHKQRLQKNREWLLDGGLESFVDRQWAELNQLGIHREDFYKNKPKQLIECVD